MSRVLVVDDSETVVNFLRMVLESQQYEVDTASDGNEGLAKAHQSLPDLIITDSIMPGDFIAKPVDETELRVRTNSLLKMKAAQDEVKRYQAHLETTR